MSNNQYRININQNIYSYNNQMRPRVNNNNNPYTNQIDPGKKTVEAYKDIFGNNTIPPESRTNKPEIKYNYNIIHYDENLTNFTENKYFSSNLKMELEGTYYGINNYKLFQDICNKIKEKSQHSRNPKKYILISSGSCATKIFDYCTTININQIVLYYIFCLNIPQYLPLKNIYPKLKYVYSSFESLERDIFSNTDLKNINPIKSSNLIFFEDYNNIYIKLHFEIVRKYSLYKIFKSQNFDKKKFMELIESKNPYYKKLAKQLTFEDDEGMIQYFKEYMKKEREEKKKEKKVNTERIMKEKEIIEEQKLKEFFNGDHSIKKYISNYTTEGFYYKNINKFLREGDIISYRILSNHLSKFIYHLYDYRDNYLKNKNNNIQKNNNIIDNSFLYQNRNRINNNISRINNNINTIQINDNSDPIYLYRKMILKLEDLNIYLNSIGKVICFPAFSSTSKWENSFSWPPVNDEQNNIFAQLIIQPNNSKSFISIKEFSKFQTEEEHLFLPFSFFKINNVIKVLKNKGIYAKIYLTALDSDKPIEDMYLDFIQNYDDNLDPEGLDLLLLTNDGTKLVLNPYLNSKYL